jgi:hypothetical protein
MPNALQDVIAKKEELFRLESAAERLRTELHQAEHAGEWPPRGYYLLFHIQAGMILGLIGGAVSLLFNVIGSLVVVQHPLQLIRVYLTFPLGEAALQMDSGVALAIGCCLYLFTGALYGIGFHVVMSRFFPDANRAMHFSIASAMGVALWVVNYYAILSWLQPMLFGGAWIVEMVPWWVAAATHLVFAWTMAAIDYWGRFESYMPR